jgi:predicted HTH transcriptional regulator
MADQFTEKIFAAIIENPGQTARELGIKLGIDKKDVNSTLYGLLKGKCRQDEKYRWYPIEGVNNFV